MSRRTPARLSVSLFALLPAVAVADPTVPSSVPSNAQPSSEEKVAANTPVQTIIVTASPIIGNPDRFATIVQQVTSRQILESGGANVADSLAKLPGVDATNFSAGSSRPVIRGFDSYRVRVMENSIGSFDVSDIGADHGVPIDPLAAQDIEVVRGAATLRYGSQAIGGVVNVINNRVPTKLPDQPFVGSASGGYDTDASAGDGSVLMDGRIGDLALHADGFTRHASNYDTPLGTQDNSFFRGDSYSGGGSYFFDDGNSRVGGAIIHYDAKYGIPSDTTFIDMRQTKELVGSSFAIDAGPIQTLNLTGGYASYIHDEDNPDGSINSTFLDHEWEQRAELVIGKTGFLSASAIGFQAQHRDFSALGADGDYLFPTHTKSFAGFAFAEAPAGKSGHFQFAVRAENDDVHGTPASDVLTGRSFVPVSGSAGVLFELSDALKLGLTLSSAARAPEQAEL
ncbi:MAG TPA: TonB-dependent receptor, partial [Alphaproteobacteria bacterium]|nr:TonB-dependent receptor [Alphaproteobacteria bacterium]